MRCARRRHLIHSDTNENKTARSGNALQVDGRYDKVIATAIRLLVHTIDTALRKHSTVRVRILKGNHDEHASVAVAYGLMGWYRNEPRVTVDVDPRSKSRTRAAFTSGPGRRRAKKFR